MFQKWLLGVNNKSVLINCTQNYRDRQHYITYLNTYYILEYLLDSRWRIWEEDKVNLGEHTSENKKNF